MPVVSRLAVPAVVVASAAVLTAASLTGCSAQTTALSARQKQIQSTSTNVKFNSCHAQCNGEIDGAKYEIKLPTKWNGTLLLYSHGYRFATPTPAEPGSTVQTTAQISSNDQDGTGSDELSRHLLSQGYALAGSSYDSNGWAVADGVAAGEALHARFVKLVGTPKRTYVWGDSLGGLITEILAERNPSWVDGAAPMCGAVAGPNLNFDMALDVAYAVKTLIDPSLQLTNYSSAQQAAAQWTQAAAAIKTAAADVAGGGTAKVFLVGALVNAPTKTESFDGDNIVSQIKALTESVLTALAFGTSGRYELEQRVGGNPSGNASVDYAKRLSNPELAMIKTLGGDPTKLLGQLAAGTRVTPDAAARAKFEALGDTTGAIKVPTLTMHTEYDPLVLVANEWVLQQRAIAKKATSDLVQLYIAPPATYSESSGAPYGAGHCVFSDSQREDLITALNAWVTTSVRPVPVGLTSEFGPGLDPTFTNQPWPAE